MQKNGIEIIEEFVKKASKIKSHEEVIEVYRVALNKACAVIAAYQAICPINYTSEERVGFFLMEALEEASPDEKQ